MKTVIEMAHETLDRMAPDDYCFAPYWTATDKELEAFAALVRADAIADEREACAKLMDEMAAQDKRSNYYQVAANAIRARSNT